MDFKLPRREPRPWQFPGCSLVLNCPSSGQGAVEEKKKNPTGSCVRRRKTFSPRCSEVSDLGFVLWNLWSCLHPYSSPVSLVWGESSVLVQHKKDNEGREDGLKPPVV